MSDVMIELFVAITIEVVVVVWIGIKFYAKKAVEHGFKEELEDHKHELSLITEETKFNYGRLNQDFGLWTVKRHDAYAKLHNSTADAISKVMSLRGLLRLPDYEKFTKDEIKQLLKDRNFIQTDIDSVVHYWDSDRQQAMSQFNRFGKLYREHQAEVACGEAQNSLIYSQLYIGDEIYTMLNELLLKLNRLLINYRSQYWDEAKGKEDDELRQFIPDAWEKLTAKMRSDLSGGYVKE